MKRIALFSIALWLLAMPASAAVIDVRIEADGGLLGPTVLDVTIDNSFDAIVFDQTDGLTINELTFGPGVSGFAEPLVYDYISAFDRLVIGGGGDASLLIGSDVDFRFTIDGLFGTPTIRSTIDADGVSSAFGAPIVSLLSVTEATPLPLPATAWLLLAGLGGLATLRGRAQER